VWHGPSVSCPVGGRQPQMPEETHNHRGIFDQGDQREASATPWTGEHIQPLPE